MTEKRHTVKCFKELVHVPNPNDRKQKICGNVIGTSLNDEYENVYTKTPNSISNKVYMTTNDNVKCFKALVNDPQQND